ncbi:hypothetical protein PZN02_004742 [Sinorhizobium garamanticum]|uniref:Uncharacterized protein n=1 Tax=Sinorhizobium garamanticum TaxID=680247 RepID=A0ABY8DJN9_9HYPH|nr:hypothetical protein [Sinorhizobium garamanticum]WEX91119.1 hypothetical protein PZN02_004742 [Sinorhizobium garamanticum]
MTKRHINLARRIRRIMTSARNIDFLRSLPVFQVQPLPLKFVDLLQQLDDEENNAGEAGKTKPPLGTN